MLGRAILLMRIIISGKNETRLFDNDATLNGCSNAEKLEKSNLRKAKCEMRNAKCEVRAGIFLCWITHIPFFFGCNLVFGLDID